MTDRHDERAGSGSLVSDDMLMFRSTTMHTSLRDVARQPVTISIRAALQGMFVLSREPLDEGGAHDDSQSSGQPQQTADVLTCYRRNRFQVIGEVAMSTWPCWMGAPGNREISGSGGGGVGTYGGPADDEIYDTLTAELTAVETRDWTQVVILAANSRDAAESAAAGGPAELELTERTAVAEAATGRNRGITARSANMHAPLVWERLQFRSATANNGRKRREIRQRFRVDINVFATRKRDGAKECVATASSSLLTVRGRSPKNFEARDDHPLIMVADNRSPILSRQRPFSNSNTGGALSAGGSSSAAAAAAAAATAPSTSSTPTASTLHVSHSRGSISTSNTGSSSGTPMVLPVEYASHVPLQQQHHYQQQTQLAEPPSSQQSQPSYDPTGMLSQQPAVLYQELYQYDPNAATAQAMGGTPPQLVYSPSMWDWVDYVGVGAGASPGDVDSYVQQQQQQPQYNIAPHDGTEVLRLSSNVWSPGTAPVSLQESAPPFALGQSGIQQDMVLSSSYRHNVAASAQPGSQHAPQAATIVADLRPPPLQQQQQQQQQQYYAQTPHQHGSVSAAVQVQYVPDMPAMSYQHQVMQYQQQQQRLQHQQLQQQQLQQQRLQQQQQQQQRQQHQHQHQHQQQRQLPSSLPVPTIVPSPPESTMDAIVAAQTTQSATAAAAAAGGPRSRRQQPPPPPPPTLTSLSVTDRSSSGDVEGREQSIASHGSSSVSGSGPGSGPSRPDTSSSSSGGGGGSSGKKRYTYVPVGLNGWQPPAEPVYWLHPWIHMQNKKMGVRTNSSSGKMQSFFMA